jgi:fermentation-respiration switch protein FrsA (DUF1100 family)
MGKNKKRSRSLIFLLTILISMNLSSCVESLFYYPDSITYSSPSRYGLKYDDVYFKSIDGTDLNGWFIHSLEKPAKGTVIQFHGNAQNISSHFEILSFLPKYGYNLFTFDYRGYGKSESKKPTRKGTFEDGLSAVDFVRTNYNESNVILFGQSLGGSISVSIASKRKYIKCLIIESTFSSHQKIVKSAMKQMIILYPFSPLAKFLISSGYDVEMEIKNVFVPVFIMHGTDDNVIPYFMSEEIYKLANSPKKFWRIEGAGHLNAYFLYREEYQKRIISFLDNN